MTAIIGRSEEQRQLNLLAKSSKAEFIAVYGRRRVGKTYLITEHFRNHYQWRSTYSSPAAQIDLILDRADGIINICEMKFASTPYLIKKSEYEKLKNRVFSFQAETGMNKGMQLTFVTPFGLQTNEYANDVVQQVTLDDLFTEA